jgi:type II secretory pathway component PulK
MKNFHANSWIPSRTTRGAVMIMVIVWLSVSTMMLMAILRQSISTTKQLRQREHLDQTRRLVHAGMDRAKSKLAKDENYQVENWNVTLESSTGQRNGRVDIVVHGEPGAIEVSAIFPAESPNPTTIRFSVMRTVATMKESANYSHLGIRS